ncbi:MAG: hypothetical protein HY716_06445 [Planctomycetes bacterium]|nr:hypothetical protein [Planctomycetota bacterium]
MHLYTLGFTVGYGLLCNWAVEQDTQKPQSVATSLKIGSHEVDIKSTDRPGQILISVNKGQRTVECEVAQDAAKITRIVASKWSRSGIAMAIEATSAKGSRRSYYWATLNKRDGIEGDLEKPVVSRFLSDTEEEFDLIDIKNPSGDSIHITLMRHTSNPEQEPNVGYLYVHVCPIDPRFRADSLYELRATKVVLPK